jgi:hypothetical protein
MSADEVSLICFFLSHYACEMLFVSSRPWNFERMTEFSLCSHHDRPVVDQIVTI